MPGTRTKKPVRLGVTDLAPLSPTMEEWERPLIEPVLARLFEVPKASTPDKKEVRDGEETR